MYNKSLLAPLNLLSSSALKNSIVEPFKKVYVDVVLCHCERFHLSVLTNIFLKSFITPLLKCGVDSATIEHSKPAVDKALFIMIGAIPNVFPDYMVCPPTIKQGDKPSLFHLDNL